jgi:hypothetical protein
MEQQRAKKLAEKNLEINLKSNTMATNVETPEIGGFMKL